MEAQPCVYILASKRNGTLYTGVTRYPAQRIWQHKQGLVRGFTKKYSVHRLVYIELHDTMPAAIQREANQGMEEGVEAPTDRECKPELA